jgi:hypothetical protein
LQRFCKPSKEFTTRAKNVRGESTQDEKDRNNMENDEQNLNDDLDEAPTKGEYFYEHRFPEVDELVMARVNRCDFLAFARCHVVSGF